jgi:hypothetical protein
MPARVGLGVRPLLKLLDAEGVIDLALVGKFIN